MKAKVKSTGEIIIVTDSPDNGNPDYMYNRDYKYCNISTNEIYTSKQLDFKDVVDWEQRRYEISKDVLCSIRSHEDTGLYREEMVQYAVELADELIKQLKVNS